MTIEIEKNVTSGSTVIDENRGRDDVRQNPKKRGTSKDVVASLDQRVASVETSMAELKNQVDGLEGLDSAFTSMREDFRVAIKTLSGDLKREIHDLRDSFMGEITKISGRRSLDSGGGNTNHGPKIDVPKPSPFVGKQEARAVDDFLWETEQYLEGVNVRRRYGNLERGTATIDTWAEFVADFKKQFYQENCKIEAKSRLPKLNTRRESSKPKDRKVNQEKVVSMDDFKVVLGLEFLDKVRAFPMSFANSLCILDGGKTFMTDESSSKVEVPKVIERVLDEFMEVMSKELPKKLQPRRELDHTIKLEMGSKPPAKAPYRMPPPELEELCNQLKELMDAGYIRPSKASYGSGVISKEEGRARYFTKLDLRSGYYQVRIAKGDEAKTTCVTRKKEGSLRICIDYQALNKVTIKNKYLIPLIADLFDQLGKARYFTKLDLRSGYYQVRIAKGEEAKTTCVTRYGSYEFLVMPFGLTNAPATFCTLMNKLFHPFLDKFVVVYLDDMVIYIDTLEEHVLHLKQVFHVLRDNKLYVKLEKCSFAQDEVELLGHKIKDGGLTIDGAKIKAIQDWEPPTKVIELRSFFGLVNYYRRFIMGYLAIASPLTDLLKKNKAWIWDEECQTELESLNKAFMEEPVLRPPDVTMPLELHTDASDFAIGGVLMQDGHPIAFESRKLNEMERKYTVQEKEMAAVVHCLRIWRHYFLGLRFVIKMVNISTSYFQTQNKLSPKREILKECPDSKWVGHPRITRMLALVEGTYYSPKMRDDVETFVRTCLICQQDKIEKKKSRGLLEPLLMPKGPWECFHGIYHMLAEVRRGRSIIVVVDRLSKYGNFIAAPLDVTADDTAKLFFKNVVKY
nr:hypothetical protein [Tanacetum cinerariifolium]